MSEGAQPRLLERQGALWVVAKPAGYAAHPAGEVDVPDLLSWARAVDPGEAGLAPVHRLDRETSGVVLLCSDPRQRAELGDAFARAAVTKTYVALVHGKTHRKGVVRRPLKDPRRRRPLEAVTRYRRLELLGPLTLLEARPETGRHHQIRRHLTGIGHPIVGDGRYHARRFRPVPGFPGRLWLHAATITLPDGRRFEAALPPELAAHLELLRSISGGAGSG